MEPEPKFFLEGKEFVVFWHRSGDRNDPLDFFEGLPPKTRLTLAGTIQSYADEGKVPSRASGHEQAWLNEAAFRSGEGACRQLRHLGID
jgi:hypothetical protein